MLWWWVGCYCEHSYLHFKVYLSADGPLRGCDSWSMAPTAKFILRTKLHALFLWLIFWDTCLQTTIFDGRLYKGRLTNVREKNKDKTCTNIFRISQLGRVGEEGGEIALITDPGAIWAFWNLRESFRNVELFNDGSIYINCYVDSFEEF